MAAGWRAGDVSLRGLANGNNRRAGGVSLRGLSRRQYGEAPSGFIEPLIRHRFSPLTPETNVSGSPGSPFVHPSIVTAGGCIGKAWDR